MIDETFLKTSHLYNEAGLYGPKGVEIVREARSTLTRFIIWWEVNDPVQSLHVANMRKLYPD
jgi:hypothetical protein